jgi:acyl-CoA synthetase (AMP-forming)/AMP-acid ligase II
VEALEEALDRCGSPGEPPSENPWKSLLFDRLCDRALPATIWKGNITPAASLWTGSRLWTQAFRSGGLEAGDRLVIALPSNTTFVQVLLAAIWQGCTVCLVPSSEDVDAACEELDARAAVAEEPGPHVWTPEGYAGPRTTPDALRSVSAGRTPSVRFLMRTSGTTGLARWVALSDRNVLSVLRSHLPHFRLNDGRVLSVLPWTHAFGLILDFFPALLAGAEIIRAPEGGRSPRKLLKLSEAWGSTHLSTVPLVIERLLACDGGEALLRNLQGGIVGGAPVSGPMAEKLSETRLRAGYGQTEASPGIALGEPGHWEANYLGRPVGCSVDVAPDGELLFSGDNACVGFWEDGGLHRADPQRTVRTGDLVRRDGDHLFFRGRKDDAFKLSNGRLVQASACEAEIKNSFPTLHDALLFTHNGRDLTLAVCPSQDAPDADRPSDEALLSALGSLAARTDRVVSVSPDEWASTPKGAVDRSAMIETLTADLPAASRAARWS